MARLGLLVVLLVLLLAGSAGPASAHATLLESDPAEGQVLEVAPEQITFRFSEGVKAAPGGVRVFDAVGAEVASEASARGAELDVALTGPVEEGTVIVVWRVISADSHPVTGSLSFAVGAPSESVAAPPTVPPGETEAPLSLSLVRGVGYLGLLIAAGLVSFAVLVLPAGRDDGQPAGPSGPRLVAAARIAAVVAAFGWLVALPLTATYQLGSGLGSALDLRTWSTLAPAEYVAAAAVVVGLTLAVRWVPRRGPAALGAAGVALLAPALTGHTRAAVPELLAVGADVLHLVAGSVWLGGLLALVLTVPDLAGRGLRAAAVLDRFSTIAAGILGVLAVTGTLLAWRVAGSWGTLFDSGYGRLLLVKIAVALVAVLIAAWNRWALLGALRRATRRRERLANGQAVVRTVRAEAVVLVAVVLLTGFLVDETPESDTEVAAAAAALERLEPGQVNTTIGEVEAQLTVAPGTPGPNTLDLELLDKTGEPSQDFEQLRVRLTSEDLDLGAVDLDYVAPGRYRSEVVLPSVGTWRMQVSLRISEFENPVGALEFQIRV